MVASQILTWGSPLLRRTTGCSRRLTVYATLRLPGTAEPQRSGAPGKAGDVLKGASPCQCRSSQPHWPRGRCGLRSRKTRSVDRGTCWQSRAPRKRATPGGRRAPHTRKARRDTPGGRGVGRPGGVGDLWHAPQPMARHPGGPASDLGQAAQVRTGHPQGDAREARVQGGGPLQRTAEAVEPRSPHGTGGGGGGQGAGPGERGPADQGPAAEPGAPCHRCAPASGRPLRVPARDPPRPEPGAGVPPAGICAGGPG